MSEEEIRLDQTKKVFDTLADLISKNETCSYRYLIYDLLGFEHGDYGELMSGMSITNKLVECETQKELLDKIKEKGVIYYDPEYSKIYRELCSIPGANNTRTPVIVIDDEILELLEEIE